MTTTITEHDQDAGATSTRYHYTRVVEIAGRTVRARVERGLYSTDSGAVAEVLTDQAEWSSLAADALNNWWHDTPPPSPDIHTATVLGPLADRLLHRAAEILTATPTTVTLSPHVYRAVSALLATSSGFNAECRIDPDDIVGDQPRRHTAHLRAPRRRRHLHQSPPRRMPFRGKQRRSGLRRRMLLRPSAPGIGTARTPRRYHP